MSSSTNLDFLSIQVTDLELSKKFYKEILNFKETKEKRPDAVVFENAAGTIFAIREPLFEIEDKMVLGLGVSLWFGVEDIEEFFKKVKDTDAKIITSLTDGPFGKMFIIKDPDGYNLTFHQI